MTSRPDCQAAPGAESGADGQRRSHSALAHEPDVWNGEGAILNDPRDGVRREPTQPRLHSGDAPGSTAEAIEPGVIGLEDDQGSDRLPEAPR